MDSIAAAGRQRKGAGADWLLLALLPLAALLLASCARERRTERPPDVVIVLIDALRADRLGVNHYPLRTTPHIDALATAGMSLTAFAHSTWTKSSVASLFTGVYPSQHGLQDVGAETGAGLVTEVLADHWQTLAERFRAGGWATAAFVNQVHLNPRFGFAQGFNRYHWVRGKDAFQLNRAFAGWLPSVGERPVFAYLHYLDVHWPYDRVLEGASGRFGSTRLPEPPPGRGMDVDAWARRWLAAGGAEGSVVAALSARYDQEVAYADAALGELTETLRQADRLDNTILVVTADHGEAFWEHGHLLHGHLPFDELIRVPLVVRLPAALRLEAPGPGPLMGLVDLLPTLLDWAGLPPAAWAEGVALRRLQASGRSRLIFVETAQAIALRTHNAKLLRFPGGREVFYDLAADPGERRALPCAARCAPLRAALDAFLARVAADRAGAPETVPIDLRHVEELKALGYL